MPDIIAPKPAPGAPIESAWGGEVHNAIEGIQTGIETIDITTGANSWTETLTFPRAFAAAPVVVVSTTSGSGIFWASTGAPSAASVPLKVNRKDEANQTSPTAINVAWIAIGPIA